MRNDDVRVNHAMKLVAAIARYVFLIALVMVFLIGGFYVWQLIKEQAAKSLAPEVETISADTLEERYGLRVRLIAVTAGGGMIDFRLKIVDAEKAKQVLENPERIPSLFAVDKAVTLVAPSDLEQDIQLTDGGVFFILFGNSGGAVKPGSLVIVDFGDFQLEPIPAQ